MPIHEGSDNIGSFWQWGGHGKKYYFCTEHGKCPYGQDSSAEAKSKAGRQAAAAHAHGYRGD